jgi:hypothetical protein
MLGEDYEALSNCVVGAIRYFIAYYRSNTQSRAFCESFKEADLRTLCLQGSEEYYKEAFNLPLVQGP